MKLTPEDLTKLRDAIRSTWQAVAPDVEGIEDNEEAMEVCIDANRLAMYGGPKGKEADKLVHELCQKHGYHVVLKELSKHFDFV